MGAIITREVSGRSLKPGILNALKKKKEEDAKLSPPMSLNMVLSKFDLMHVGLVEIKRAFNRYAKKDTLNKENLVLAVKNLNADVSAVQIQTVFDISDVDSSRYIDFKEFITALVIALAVNELPPESTVSDNDNTTKYQNLREMLGLIISAYLLLDKNCKGYLTRSDVENVLKDTSMKQHKETNVLAQKILNQEKWNDMAWDKNDNVDFPEFTTKFAEWVIDSDHDHEPKSSHHGAMLLDPKAVAESAASISKLNLDITLPIPPEVKVVETLLASPSEAAIHNTIIISLKKKKEEDMQAEHRMTFERILLKFDQMHTVVSNLKTSFNKHADKNGLLTRGSLVKAIQSFHANASESKIEKIFEISDLDTSRLIDFKEFITALTIAMAVNELPPESDKGKQPHQQSQQQPPQPQNVDEIKSKDKESSSIRKNDAVLTSFRHKPKPIHSVDSQYEELREMLSLITSAYLLFDPDCKGFITKVEVNNLIQTHAPKNHPSHAQPHVQPKGTEHLLSEERWNEMDWDGNGCIDYAEFACTFAGWAIDIDGADNPSGIEHSTTTTATTTSTTHGNDGSSTKERKSPRESASVSHESKTTAPPLPVSILSSSSPKHETNNNKKEVSMEEAESSSKSLKLFKIDIQTALKNKKEEDMKLDGKLTMERILLKFDKMNVIFNNTKKAFDHYATKDGNLSRSNLVAAIQTMHEDASVERIGKIFEISDVDTSRAIDFKEFLTALTIAMVLNELPPSPKAPQESLAKYDLLRDCVGMIASAYLLFDPDCNGNFSKNTPHAVGGGNFLSEERWNEMDWDGNGDCDFAEFACTFVGWVIDTDSIDDQE